MISYKIDGVELSTYGIRVSNTKGLHNLPKMKKPLTTSFPDRHGERVDLSSVYYEARDIELDCWIEATSRIYFLTKLNTFITTALVKTGLRQLLVAYDSSKPLCYMCYFESGLDVTRETKWNAARMFGSFTLKLREPEPFKRLYKFTPIEGDMDCNFAINCPTSLTLYWGDGTSTHMPAGESNAVKNYTTPGITFYIALVGNVNEITSIGTIAVEIWNLQ